MAGSGRSCSRPAAATCRTTCCARSTPTGPHICRGFDNTGCEVNAPGGMTIYREPREFLEYLKARRPRIYRTIAKKYLPPALR